MPDDGLSRVAHHAQISGQVKAGGLRRSSQGRCVACLTVDCLRQHSVCRHLGNAGQMTTAISVLNSLPSHRPTLALKCTTQLPQGELPLRAS